MSKLFDSLRKRLGKSAIKKCRADKSKCTISLGTFPEHFKAVDKIAIGIDDAVKGNKVTVKGKRCDFLIIIEQINLIIILPIEVKTKNFPYSEMPEKIGGGLKIFEQLIQERKKKIIFIPCLLSERIRKRDFKELMKLRVSFRGQRQRIRYVPCGKRFWEIIERESLNRGS